MPVEHVVNKASASAVKAVEELDDPDVAVKELTKAKNSLKKDDEEEEKSTPAAPKFAKEAKKTEDKEEDDEEESKESKPADKVLKKVMSKNKIAE